MNKRKCVCRSYLIPCLENRSPVDMQEVLTHSEMTIIQWLWEVTTNQLASITCSLWARGLPSGFLQEEAFWVYYVFHLILQHSDFMSIISFNFQNNLMK